MCAGLKAAGRRKRFSIDMDTYGYYDAIKDICYGCAATCTLQQLSRHEFQPHELDFVSERARGIGLSYGQGAELFRDFEITLDLARRGKIEELFLFFHLPVTAAKPYMDLWHLTTDNWRKEIKKVEQTAKQMKKDGF